MRPLFVAEISSNHNQDLDRCLDFVDTAAGIGCDLSEREIQIMSGVRDGKTNAEIGAELGISPLTVKNHVQRILRKLGVANRAQAVARCLSANVFAGMR